MKVQNFYENLSTLHVGTMDNLLVCAETGWKGEPDPVERGRLEICLVSQCGRSTGAFLGKGSRKRGLYQHGSALLLADEGLWTEAVHQCPLSHPL